MNIIALVVGATGIAGRGACQELIRCGAEVHGLSRNPAGLVPRVHHVAADLLDAESLKKALGGLKPTHVYITTWSRRATEAENIEINGGMVRNLLAALAPARTRQACGARHRPEALSRPVRRLCPYRNASAYAAA